VRSVDNVPPLTVPVRGVIVRTIRGVSIFWGSAIGALLRTLLHVQEVPLHHDVETMLPDRRCVHFWGKCHKGRDEQPVSSIRLKPVKTGKKHGPDCNQF